MAELLRKVIKLGWVLKDKAGGLSPCHTRWIGKAYFYHESLKNTWRYKIITL
ncbi:MAG: IS91 family transposase, partial [Candidatus Jettenia sp.]